MSNPPRNGEGDRSAQPSGGGGPAQTSNLPPPLTAPIKTVKRARNLRKAMSLPEVLLWQELRKRPGGFKFRRQHPELIFVHDFCCLQLRLLIEVDGAAHDVGNQPRYDRWRDAVMLERGYRTLRIPARVVLQDMEDAVNAIGAACREVGPLHRPADGPPPHSGEDWL